MNSPISSVKSMDYGVGMDSITG